ncbi:MAG TPA: type VI secretion system contractile sheath large subunit, partial [Longimicrobiales bacterium]|nr:type VI secretion system contractile sheath large subunit [Longimicrobiales bacterium]
MSQRPETDVLLDVEPGTARPASRPVEERSFHVALLGDFSGRGGRGSPEGLEPVAVDRDEVDAVLARFAPTVRVGGGGDGGVEVRFGSLEDFHPDALVESVPLFRSIREVAGGGSPRPRRTRPAPDAPAAPVEKILSGSVLDRIVDEQDDAGDDGGGGARDPLQGWVDDLVRPHLEGTPDPEEARLASKVEELVAEGMRELLHDRRFRRMEALWRGVDFLVRRVETGARLTLHLVDATAAGLAADPDLGAFREFLRRGHAGEPWSLVAALWEVDARPEELVLL